MNTHDTNNSQNNTPQNSGAFHNFIFTFLTINGIATGRIIKDATDMMNNGYDRDTTIEMLLCLLVCAYTAQRIYQIYRIKKNQNNNNKTR